VLTEEIARLLIYANALLGGLGLIVAHLFVPRDTTSRINRLMSAAKKQTMNLMILFDLCNYILFVIIIIIIIIITILNFIYLLTNVGVITRFG
jgi:hypothetical protein